MTTPTCPYCQRHLDDARGCEYLEPVVYGAEQHPLSTSLTCRDCAAPLGTRHHAECSCTECASCHRQFHGGDCEANRLLVTGAGGMPA